MYVIYLALSILSKRLGHDISIPVLILLSILGIGILAVNRGDSWLWNLLCWENLTKYMQFFTLGIICSKYRERFFSLLSRNKFITFMTVGWIVCMLLWYNDAFKNFSSLAYSVVHDILVRYFALMTVVIFFFSRRDTFSGSTRGGRLLQLVGQRTLDIYMIHYFLLPDLNCISGWIGGESMLVIQLSISMTVAGIIVAVCLLVSSFLRQSHTLAAWLFGVKKRPVLKVS